MLKLVKARIVLEILGIILLSVFIWFAGPYFAFADFRPFNPEWTRLTAVALLVLIWAAIKIGKVVKAASASSKLANAVASQPDPAPSSDEAQLRERFEEAIAALKASRGRDRSLYSDPWYVIIGAPGSGKSTLLQNSACGSPWRSASGRMPCAASAARATATGGSPTMRSSWTPPGALPRRTPIPAPMPAAGRNFSRC